MAEYDDAFKTVVNDCKELLIPLVNEVFGEKFSMDARVEFESTEHTLNEPDGEQKKRYSDSVFRIVDEVTKKYHWECQTDTDSSMLIRLHEYNMNIAIDDAILEKGSLKVFLPHTAVLYLKDRKTIPDTMSIEYIDEESGDSVKQQIHVMKLQRYSMEEIFRKELLLLLPFYIFHYQGRLKNVKTDKEAFEQMKQEFLSIKGRLEQFAKQGRITEFVKVTLLDMMDRVNRKFATNYKDIVKGLGDIMGGRILETEARKILNEGRIKEYIELRREDGYSEEQIVSGIKERFHLTESEADRYISEMLPVEILG